MTVTGHTSTSELRRRRVALGVTRQQLAHEAACSTSHLATLEAGMSVGRSEVLSRAHDALDRLEAEQAAEAGTGA